MLRCKGCTFGVHRRQARGQACWGLSGRATGGRTGARERAAAGALFTLSAPHFGPPASYTRIPDQSPGYYSSPDDQWRTCAQYGTLKIPLSAKMTNDASERIPGTSRVSRDTPDLSRTPFLTGLPGPDPLTSKRHPKTGLQAPRDYRGHGTSFRRPFGTLQGFPRDVSVVFPGQRPSVGDDEPTIPHEAKGSPKRTLRCTRGNRGPRTLNSTPNVRRWQHRLSRRQVTRTFVHTTYGDIRLIQILFVQAFQIYKLIGRRRSDARSIKSQAYSGFSLSRMGPTAQPSQASKPRLNPKPRLNLQAVAKTQNSVAPSSKKLPPPHISNFFLHLSLPITSPSLPITSPSIQPCDTNPSLTPLQNSAAP
ncbi:hypothetical protein CRG98_029685 [Punica granatum]|uniref:Uncharacterized protein n=1 Tax=Punica granatum TaxID=22663 RepID=A0A2I0J0Z1_PUNGR|nr:hypothetical protein CRG98_029685 [Punica granatum]